jgi:hypothetical protein
MNVKAMLGMGHNDNTCSYLLCFESCDTGTINTIFVYFFIFLVSLKFIQFSLGEARCATTLQVIHVKRSWLQGTCL